MIPPNHTVNPGDRVYTLVGTAFTALCSCGKNPLMNPAKYINQNKHLFHLTPPRDASTIAPTPPA